MALAQTEAWLQGPLGGLFLTAGGLIVVVLSRDAQRNYRRAADQHGDEGGDFRRILSLHRLLIERVGWLLVVGGLVVGLYRLVA